VALEREVKMTAENERLRGKLIHCEQDCHHANEEIERLEGALTPSAETKAAYMGEFTMRFSEIDDEGEECMRSINVPWPTIKSIMRAIHSYATMPSAESAGNPGGES
jgi:hypothetical protein